LLQQRKSERAARIRADIKPNVQIRGGLKPMRAQRSSNSACKLRAKGAVTRSMINFLARPLPKFKENYKDQVRITAN
jgi:hypothetical protein